MFYNNPYMNPYANNNLPYNPAQQIAPNNSVMQMPQQSAPVAAPATTLNQQQETRRCNCEWIYVNGIAGVREHIVQPNQTLYFLDNNDPVFYCKSADNFGTAKIKTYRFNEVTEQSHQTAVSPQPDETVKSEIAEIKNRLDRLEGAVNNESSNQ